MGKYVAVEILFCSGNPLELHVKVKLLFAMLDLESLWSESQSVEKLHKAMVKHELQIHLQILPEAQKKTQDSIPWLIIMFPKRRQIGGKTM